MEKLVSLLVSIQKRVLFVENKAASVARLSVDRYIKRALDRTNRAMGTTTTYMSRRLMKVQESLMKTKDKFYQAGVQLALYVWS
jgi:hypothetical protein